MSVCKMVIVLKGGPIVSDTIRRNMPLFSIGIVKKLTGLSARQIRYYEQHGLVAPDRTAGNQRLYSFNDVNRLLEIKKLIDDGVNIAGIKQMLHSASAGSGKPAAVRGKTAGKNEELTDRQLHRLLKQQLIGEGKRPGQVPIIQGELSRYYPKISSKLFHL